MNTLEWNKECRYVSRLADLRGMVPEMNCSLYVAIRYAEMQRDKAEREGRHDVVTYLGECLDDMRGAAK